jgi:hypothetical protein
VLPTTRANRDLDRCAGGPHLGVLAARFPTSDPKPPRHPTSPTPELVVRRRLPDAERSGPDRTVARGAAFVGDCDSSWVLFRGPAGDVGLERWTAAAPCRARRAHYPARLIADFKRIGPGNLPALMKDRAVRRLNGSTGCSGRPERSPREETAYQRAARRRAARFGREADGEKPSNTHRSPDAARTLATRRRIRTSEVRRCVRGTQAARPPEFFRAATFA